MPQFRLTLAALALAGVATPSAAQSFDNTGRDAPGDARVQAGIVIPFGGGGSPAERAPRLEAWSDHRAQRPLPQASLRPDFEPGAVRPVRIGINFSGETRMLVNGREMPGQDNRKGVSTVGWVAIGVAVVAVALGVTYLALPRST